MKALRAAVIGLGFIGPQHIEALRRVPEAEVAAVCDANGDVARETARRWNVEKVYTDWRQVVSDPDIDVVHNCTPHFLHDEINRAAILAGKHVYCEKPLSNSAASAREMWELATAKGVAHGLNHQYRLNAAVQEMRARIKNGVSGKPLMVYGCYLQESASAKTDYDHKMENTGPARALNDIGIHWLDTACCALDQPVTAVMAQLTKHYPVRVDKEGREHAMATEDTGMILLRFADGTPGQLIVSKAACGHKNDLRLNVACEECEMDWRQEIPDRLSVGVKAVGWQSVYMNPRTCQPEVKPYISAPMGHVMGWPDALRNAVQAFYRSIVDGSYAMARQPYATFRDGFAGMAFVEACVRSNREKCWTEVEQP